MVVAEPKTFRRKLWDFVESALSQTGVGIVLLAIGALLSSKVAMGLAFCVFIVAAYRAGLFDHPERKKRVSFYIAIPLTIAVGLMLVWIFVWKIKGMADATQVESAVADAAIGSVPSQSKPAASNVAKKVTANRNGYGMRDSIISGVRDVSANGFGSKYTIYNGGVSEGNHYKDVCNGTGGIPIANMGAAKNNEYQNISDSCPPVTKQDVPPAGPARQP